MKGLDRNAPSVPPQNSPQEAVQVEMWKKYIQWEKSNPLRTEDQTLITKRGRSLLELSFCLFGYKKHCLLMIIWNRDAQYYFIYFFGADMLKNLFGQSNTFVFPGPTIIP